MLKKEVSQTLVTSRLDDCNSLFISFPSCSQCQLSAQSIQFKILLLVRGILDGRAHSFFKDFTVRVDWNKPLCCKVTTIMKIKIYSILLNRMGRKFFIFTFIFISRHASIARYFRNPGSMCLTCWILIYWPDLLRMPAASGFWKASRYNLYF